MLSPLQIHLRRKGKEEVIHIMEQQEKTWDTSQTATYLGCSPGTLRNWVSQRRVPFVKVGRLTRFIKADIDRWLEMQKVSING